MGARVGIDLGTTNSVISIYRPETGDVVPRVLQNRDGKSSLPSVIAFQNGETIVGGDAKELQAAGESVAAFFKRYMGEDYFSFESPQGDLDAIQLSAEILKALKAGAESELGEAVTDAVITLPAYFRDRERKATIEAGRQAGLNVLQTINEPTAAATAYGLKATNKDGLFLVYDLGGGTFDVTVLNINPTEIRILASGGDNRLGGKDWDDWIVTYAADQFRMEHGSDPLDDLESAMELQHAAETAKKQLSSKMSQRMTIIHDGVRGDYTLSRADFEAGTQSLLQRTIDTSIYVLKDLGKTPSDIDGVLLVGGSTRMPAVQNALKGAFGQDPLSGVDVDTAVSAGAALIASQYSDAGISKPAASTGLAIRTVVDVTTHSLGMISVNADGDKYINAKILERNKPVPCTETRPFVLRTKPGEANRLEIYLTQGESDSPQDVSYLGLYYADNVPHSATGQAVIDVEYAYDISGTVQVSGHVRGGAPLNIKVAPLPGDIPARFNERPASSGEHINVILTFDLSGSMSGTPLQDAKVAARRFIREIDLSSASVAIMGVANRTKMFQPLCQDAHKLNSAIDDLRIGSEVGGGNSGHPFDDILSTLGRVKGKAFAIVLADGVWANQSLAVSRAKACHSADIGIAAVGFGSANKQFLADIASTSDSSILTSQSQLGNVFGTIAQSLSETGGLGRLS